jgi:hypothetical protein
VQRQEPASESQVIGNVSCTGSDEDNHQPIVDFVPAFFELLYYKNYCCKKSQNRKAFYYAQATLMRVEIAQVGAKNAREDDCCPITGIHSRRVYKLHEDILQEASEILLKSASFTHERGEAAFKPLLPLPLASR